VGKWRAAVSDVNACIVMTSVSDQEQAEKIAKAVLEARLAACVQIQGITSHYWWNGKINKDAEQLVCFKTSVDKYEALEKAIVANHSYETPEILQVPVVAGLEKYLGWIRKETS
jgi:periplasmic divalent cation tolerance protein